MPDAAYNVQSHRERKRERELTLEVEMEEVEMAEEVQGGKGGVGREKTTSMTATRQVTRVRAIIVVASILGSLCPPPPPPLLPPPSCTLPPLTPAISFLHVFQSVLIFHEHCNILQDTAAHCNTLRHTATHCITPATNNSTQFPRHLE